MSRLSVIIFLSLAILSSCSKTEPTSGKETVKDEAYLLIGLIPEQNIFKQLERYEPLAEYLTEKIGMKVKLKVLTRYGNIVDNFVSARLDGAFFGSFSYAMAHTKLGVEVLARPVCMNGASRYHGLIFVRKDSGIRTAKDMKGKIFVFVDKATMAGYVFPLVYFKKNGIVNYNRYLKEAYFAGTHEYAIYDVLNKKADIGAAKNTVFTRFADTDKRISEELLVLDRSRDVIENGLAVRKDLDASIKQKLKETLMNMHNDPAGKVILTKFQAQEFTETKDADYADVYNYLKEINLNLATYDYINN